MLALFFDAVDYSPERTVWVGVHDIAFNPCSKDDHGESLPHLVSLVKRYGQGSSRSPTCT
jgi:hypothetical protein